MDLTDEEKNTAAQYDLIYNIVSNKLKEQLDSFNSVLQKANIMIAIIGIAITGYIQFTLTNQSILLEHPLLVLVVMLSLTLSLYWAIRAFILKPQEYFKDSPSPSGLLEAFSQGKFTNVYFIKDDIMRGIKESYEHNSTLIKLKHNFLYSSSRAFFIGFIFFMAHLAVALQVINTGNLINFITNNFSQICL